jgi:hypothetical protein
LLAAIGRVESGRRDPGTGIWGAWPWTINAEGTGAYFDTKAEAIQAVEALRARGVRSIDVGCMQVNLMHHPTAFPNLDMAFEPAVNADYAARFLIQLHEQTGDWTTATADYHSANPDEGGPYAAKVTSVWPEEQRKAGLAPSGPGGALGQSLSSGSFSPGAFGQVSRAAPPFPTHQPARLFAMAGAPPMMIPPGMMPPGASPLAMTSAAPLGRGLDFYRAAPIRTAVTTPLMVRLPYGAIVR